MIWRWQRASILAAMLTAGFIAGCAQPATTSAPPTRPAITPVIGGDKTALQTLVPANVLSDLELAAAKRGVASYTGFACTVAPAGCACDTAVLQDSSFTFTPDNRLLYDFKLKGGQPSQWQLDHSGYNQWSYTAPVAVGQAQQDALLLALLSFTPEGYRITEDVTFRTGEIAKCDNIDFHQLTPSGNPAP